MNKPKLVTISGPSGTGKTVLAGFLKSQGMEELISTTTRMPRKGEIPGVHYHFVSKPEFLAMQKKGLFVETIRLGDAPQEEYYGLSVPEVERAAKLHKTAVVVAEPHGVKQISRFCEEHGWQVTRVFLNNPLTCLITRIMDRFADDVRDLNRQNPTDEALYLKKRDSHAARIQRITQFEQDHWVKPALSHTDQYELFFAEFGSANDHQVIDAIVQAIADPTPAPSRKNSL